MSESEHERKERILREIRAEISAKMRQAEQSKIGSGIYSGMISSLLRRLIKFEGYSAVGTIVRREMRELGVHDARMIKEIFGLGDTKEDASKAIKIAAILIGYDLSVEGDETVVRACPFARMAIETNERTICNVCSEYVNGLAQGILGEDYYMDGVHDITREEPKCYFQLKKK